MKRLPAAILLLVTLFYGPIAAETAVPYDFWLLSRAMVLEKGRIALRLDGRGVNEDLYPEYSSELFGTGLFGASYGFWGRFEGGLLGSIQLDQAKVDGGRQQEIASGDLSGYLRLALLGNRFSTAVLTVEGFASAPTGSAEAGLMRAGHFTSGNLDFGGRLLISLRAPLYHVHLNAGGINYDGAESNGSYNELFLLYGAGMELFPDNGLSFWGELGGLTPARSPNDYRQYPLWSAAGVILRPFAGVGLNIGFRYNLSDRNSSRLFAWEKERFRVRAGLTIDRHLFHRRPPDSDGDGIPNRWDLNPYLPEDVDNFLDHDGAPEWDNDGDGIADHLDSDPLRPEDMDGFEDQDGAPDTDNDTDSIRP